MTKAEYVYKVVSKIVSSRIHEKFRDPLAELEIGSIITTNSFFEKYKSRFNFSSNKYTKNNISQSLKIACELKMVEKVDNKAVPKWFRELESVSFWQAQLRGSKLKYMALENTNTTKTQYVHQLWKFNKWLTEDIVLDDNTTKKRTFTVTTFHANGDSFTRKIEKKSFENVEELLHLLEQPFSDQKNVIKIIKQYLLDDNVHGKKKASYMLAIKSEIVSYFEKNEYPLQIKYNPKSSHNTETEEQEMSLAELMDFLTIGKPSITEKAMFLCKFHRGLDVVTLVDRFNHEAWEQLVKWFGSENHDSWDLEKCPVPISLTRIKNDFKHLGFLDRDAIEALCKYLDFRKKKTGKILQNGEPMFLNKFGKQISGVWVYDSFSRIAERSGIQKLMGERFRKQFKVDSHELRDLLKSTLIDSECRIDVADHVIGHKPKDSYEKQGKLYPETLRKEYAKASKRLNIFTKFSSVANGSDNTDELKAELNEKIKEADILLKQQKEQRVTQYQDQFFAMNQQKQIDSQNETIKKLSEIVNRLDSKEKSRMQEESGKLEFCCIDCKVVHDKAKCPACGSTARRIYEEKIPN